ncbi:hypothetical protein ACJX0J_010998, partial [Zea mays]
ALLYLFYQNDVSHFGDLYIFGFLANPMYTFIEFSHTFWKHIYTALEILNLTIVASQVRKIYIYIKYHATVLYVNYPKIERFLVAVLARDELESRPFYSNFLVSTVGIFCHIGIISIVAVIVML